MPGGSPGEKEHQMSYSTHPAAWLFAEQIALDSAAAAAEKKRAEPKDSVFDAAAKFEESAAKLDVAGAVQAWAETTSDDLGDGETMADRLISLIIGAAAPDAGDDEELTDEQADLANTYLELAAAYMAKLGVSDADITAVIDDGDGDAATRVSEFVADEVGGTDEERDEAMTNHAFGDDDGDEAAFDSILDAVYKKRMVVRGGKKMRVMKRVSGHVRMTGAQRIGLRKARLKSHSAGARLHRMKSMKLRQKMGMKSGI
jgi:hypothetical protein